MTFAQMISAVYEQHGFTLSRDAVKEIINERYQTMAAVAEWRVALLEVGPTVADQGNYSLSADVEELTHLRIGASGAPIDRITWAELLQLKANQAYLYGQTPHIVFAETFTEAAGTEVEIYPAPSTAGDTIYALGSFTPPVMTDENATPAVPGRFHKPIVDGAIAVCLERDTEDLPRADRFEARYDAATALLKRLRMSRMSTGPQRIRMAR